MVDKHNTEQISGKFLHFIYSPHGTIEGLMIESDEGATQLVLGEAGAAGLLPLADTGVPIIAVGEFQGWSSLKTDAHRVFSVEQLKSINGKKPVGKKPVKRIPAYAGKVARLNYARHGEPNGVVLDSGDFIHLKPEGFRRSKLQVGDWVEADGDSYPLDAERGYAVEASHINGKAVR